MAWSEAPDDSAGGVLMNVYPDARWVALRFIFEFVDQKAAQDAMPTSSPQDSMSQIEQTLEDNTLDTAYTTLEHNRWGLNQNFKPLPDNLSGVHTGWVSSVMSGADCMFEANPYLEFSFSEPHSSIGFSLHFENSTGGHPVRFNVSTYDENNILLTSKDVVNHNVKSVVSLLSPDYRRVCFTFYETSAPYRRVRIGKVVFGIVETYDNDSIAETSLQYEIDPIADRLPSRKAVFKIDNSGRRFNLVNPEGIYAYLQQPQSFSVFMGVGDSLDTVEQVSMGEFYFTTASAEDSGLTAEISAYDWFYWMDKTAYSNTLTGTWTLEEAVTAILADAGISCDIVMPESAGLITLNKITEEVTHREAMRLAVQAACCTAFFDRSGRLVILDLASADSVDTLDNNNMSTPPKVIIDEAVNTVTLSATDAATGVVTVYTASNIIDDEMVQVKSVTNNMIHSSMGQSVADWLLHRSQSKLKYSTRERGNPETNLTDTVKIYDYFNVNRNAVVTKQTFNFNGGLSVESEAITFADA